MNLRNPKYTTNRHRQHKHTQRAIILPRKRLVIKSYCIVRYNTIWLQAESCLSREPTRIAPRSPHGHALRTVVPEALHGSRHASLGLLRNPAPEVQLLFPDQPLFD